jgi:hypothetical protein
MIVVVHQTVGVANPSLLFHFFSQKIEKTLPIVIIQEDAFLPIAPRG